MILFSSSPLPHTRDVLLSMVSQKMEWGDDSKPYDEGRLFLKHGECYPIYHRAQPSKRYLKFCRMQTPSLGTSILAQLRDI